MRKQYLDLDESATRLMINNLLTKVLGYTELEEIKTEYRIRGEYADYIVQLARKKHFVVEVKSIQLDLNEKHLRQSINYAANEGIDWIILTNGKQIQLYKVLFKKPISSRKIFDFDLTDKNDFKKIPEFLVFLTKKSVQKNELENFWKRFEALEPTQLSKHLYDIKIVKFLKKTLKNTTDLSFNEDDILDSIHQIILTKIDSNKPKNPTNGVKKKKRCIPKEIPKPIQEN
ncbi:MAG: type I restriction enzyme HsdR N-terminal domain-containing protein [Candidatus Moranbacteria bacterium]|nr:type I restriction enzyme HsdR N-terminal domain-containing protein [Candidatus Moranbacteria bacterium]